MKEYEVAVASNAEECEREKVAGRWAYTLKLEPNLSVNAFIAEGSSHKKCR